MALADGVLCRFPAPEHVKFMMCDREVEPQARPTPVRQVYNAVVLAGSSPSVHHGHPSAPSGLQVHHGVAFATSTPPIHHGQPPAASAPPVHHTCQVVEERMEMDVEAAAVTSSGGRTTAPRPGAGKRFALVEEFWNVKSASDPPSQNMEDAPSEQLVVEGQLAQQEWEIRILLD